MTSSEFLNITLSREPTPAEIDELMANHVNEDLWLDYKRGRWLTDSDAKRQRKLRRYVSGFANADGGVVLVGVAGSEKSEQTTDKQWAVDGCPSGQSQAWDEWASNSLSPLAGYFSRQPRIYVIEHNDGAVLIVAVHRSNMLVPCVEDGRPVHHMRIGHQTLKIDPSLYADLILGRRQSPHCNVDLIKPSVEIGHRGQSHALNICLIVRNDSLVWVSDMQIGIIGMTAKSANANSRLMMRCTPGGSGREQLNAGDVTEGEITISSTLSGYVKVHANHQALTAEPFFIRSRPMPAPIMAPFASVACSVKFSLPTIAGAQQCSWLGAIYIVPINGIPQWFEISIESQPMPPHGVTVTKYEAVRIDDQLIPIGWIQ